MVSKKAAPRKSYSKIAHVLELPNLVQVQLDSFRRFCDQQPNPDNPDDKGGLRTLFDEVSPIQDFTGTRFELSFLSYGFGEKHKAGMPRFLPAQRFFR